jgi:hypothetical protein
MSKLNHLLFLLFVLPALFSCEEFQSQEYKISELDNKACQLLADSLADTVYTNALTNYDTSWTDDNVAQNVNQILDSLQNDNIIVKSFADLSNLIASGSAENSAYVMYQSTSGTAVFFSSQSVILSLFDEQGNLLTPSDQNISYETAGGCTYLNENDVAVPLILTRLAYGLANQRYLVQLTKTDQTTSDNIYVSILYQ